MSNVLNICKYSFEFRPIDVGYSSNAAYTDFPTCHINISYCGWTS